MSGNTRPTSHTKTLRISPSEDDAANAPAALSPHTLAFPLVSWCAVPCHICRFGTRSHGIALGTRCAHDCWENGAAVQRVAGCFERSKCDHECLAPQSISQREFLSSWGSFALCAVVVNSRYIGKLQEYDRTRRRWVTVHKCASLIHRPLLGIAAGGPSFGLAR